MADGSANLLIPGGLESVDLEGLRRCLSETAGLPLPVQVIEPVISPALFLGAPGLERISQRMRPQPGHALIHESQSFSRVPGEILAGDLAIRAAEAGGGSSRVFDFEVSDGSGRTKGNMQTRLRDVTPDDMAHFRGSVMPDHMDQGDVDWIQSNPFSPKAVGSYLEISRDNNPIHKSRAAANAAGLEDAVVPGMFIAGLCDLVIGAAIKGAWIKTMKLRFMAPVPVGEQLRYGVKIRRVDKVSGDASLRVLILRNNRVIAAIADIETRLVADQAT